MRQLFSRGSFVFLTLVAILIPSYGVWAQPRLPVLSYDELVKNQKDSLGKQVRLDAIWTFGFEWTYLCSSGCTDISKAWVDFVDEESLCDGSKGKLKRLGKKADNKARVRVIGKLDAGAQYGHSSAYSLLFTISCVEKFQKIY